LNVFHLQTKQYVCIRKFPTITVHQHPTYVLAWCKKACVRDVQIAALFKTLKFWKKTNFSTFFFFGQIKCKDDNDPKIFFF
jgi:hypothetical protein